MTDSKSIWRFLTKLFRKKINKSKKSQKNAPKEQEIEEEFICDNIGLYLKATSLKRHPTCSFDLSDKTLCLINTQQLINEDLNSIIHRTSSFSVDKNFPRKLLPIADFQEREVLGQGAFGRAIKVEHIKSGCYFVLKEVLTNSRENEECLIREVFLLRSLKHHNLLTAIGIILKNKSICLLTELMEGGSLQSRIMNLNEDISLSQRVSFLRDITSGMNFLHQHSIVHRDLTSTNCLLRKDNSVVVSDFGLSKLLYDEVEYRKSSECVPTSSTESVDRDSRDGNLFASHMDISPKMSNFLSIQNVTDLEKRESLTSDDVAIHRGSKVRQQHIRRKHTVVGNPYWMAPEMLAGKNYDSLVDIYSFGVIGCEVIARVSAHPDVLERTNKDMSVNFCAFLLKHGDGELCHCPQDLLDLVQRCCQPSPDDRPSFNTLLSWIEDILFRLTNHIRPRVRLDMSANSDT